MGRILIVDDEANVHYSFKRVLGQDMEVLSARSCDEALDKVKTESLDLVIMDVRMPGRNGIDALTRIKELDADLPVIIMTAYGTMQTAVEAMKFGAFEYIPKPFDILKMRALIQKALETREKQKESMTYLSKGGETEEVILGSSSAMQEVYKLIGQVAGEDVIVLLRGESGTGKELVARAIHRYSRRADKPFIVVNSAAIPDTLIESELFGHEKGAFTGAVDRMVGKFEQGAGGTIFLDEIGDMPLSTQSKILRVIQEREFTRLGGSELIRADARLIVATNKNLERAIAEGRFREDLYYRLNVISINLPPLRARKEDILELVPHFLNKFNAELNKEVKSIGDEAMKRLMEYDWPGNVRELENCIKRAMILNKSGTLELEDLQVPTKKERVQEKREKVAEKILDASLESFFSGQGEGRIMPMTENILIRKALQKTGGNQVQAARLLGISRNTLRNRIQKYNLTKEVRIVEQ